MHDKWIDIEKAKESRKMFMDPDAYDIVSFNVFFSVSNLFILSL